MNKKLEKNKKIAQSMETSRLAELERHREKQIKDYAEFKMIRGHSKEKAYAMAKQHILNSNE